MESKAGSRGILDAIGVPAGWEPSAAYGLISLLERSPRDIAVLPDLFERIVEDLPLLKTVSAGFRKEAAFRTHGHVQRHPIPTLLNDLASQEKPATLALRLTAIAVTLAVRSEQEAGALAQIASAVVRKEGPKAKALSARLPDVGSVADLLFKYENLRQKCKDPKDNSNQEDREDIPHRTFNALWTRTLYQKLRGAVLAGSFRNASSIADPTTALDVDGEPAEARIPLVEGDAEDESADLGLDDYPERELKQRPGEPDTERAIAKARSLLRRSSTRVCRYPDDIIPAPVLRNALNEVSRRASEALIANEVETAIDMISVQLVAITACRVAELSEVFVGHEPTIDACAIDADHGFFLRHERRPIDAFNPEPTDHRWLATEAVIAVCLPNTLVTQLKELCRVRGIGPGGRPLRSEMPTADTSVQPRLARTIRIADALEQIAPGIHVGANALRERLAAYMTAELGPEVAQVALGDSFGMSTAATYYYRSKASCITAVAWRYASTLCSDGSRGLIELPPALDGDIGSRAAVPDDQLALRAEAVVPPPKHTADREQVRQTWVGFLTRAASALVYSTGQRINASLGELTIDDISPEYGLVALSDKRSTLAHFVRIAAVADAAVAAIQDYVSFLVDLHRHQRPFADLARAVLSGGKPLFSWPASAGDTKLDVKAFRQSLLGEFTDKPNVLRHHLNHALIRAGANPALRHQQLGWIVTPATALSNASPWSAMDFSRQMAPYLDQYMVVQGWITPKGSRASDWKDLPLPKLIDWSAAEKHQRRCEKAVHSRTITKVQERRDRILLRVRPKLQEAFSALVPGAKLDSADGEIQQTTAGAPPLEIDKATVLAILAHASEGEGDPTVPIVARAELARIFTTANTRHTTHAYVPAYQKYNFSSQPSPFLRGFGRAVRQAQWIRHLVRSDVDWQTPQGDACASACRVMLGIVLFTPFRTFDLARQIMMGATRAQRGHTEPDFIRLPLGRSHVVLTGEAALLLGAWQTHGHLPNHDRVAKYLYTALDPIVGKSTTPSNICARIEGLAKTAGRVELAGPERSFLLEDFALNVVDAERSLSNSDDWPLRCATPGPNSTPGTSPPDSSQSWRTASACRSQIRTVTALVNSNLDLVLPSSGRKIPKDAQGREAIVRSELDEMLQQPSPLDVGRAITEYTRFVIADRHEKGAQEVQLVTAHTYITRFAIPLADALDEGADFASLTTEDIWIAYAAVLFRKRPRSANSPKGNYRRHVYDALHRFHGWLREAHGVDEIEWAGLAAIAGERFNGVDPGLVSPPEIDRVLLQLEKEADARGQDETCSPDSRDESEQRALFAAILASSHCRPASVHGLTLGDLHFTDDGDWVHVRRTGVYGSAKTTTSLGFHRLVGPGWQRSRKRWVDWTTRARAHIGDGTNEYPVFGRLGDPRERRPRPFLTARLGQLLRWVTDNVEAHPYWLRKTGVIATHRALWANSGSPTPLDFQCTLSGEGHLDELTALRSYLHEPAVIFAAYLRAQPHLTANDVIGLTGIKRVTIETAWQRAKPDGGSVRSMSASQRVAVALGCLGYKFAEAPAERITAPPTDNSKAGSLRCTDVAGFIEQSQVLGTGDLAAIRAGLTKQQSKRVLEACGKWFERTGYTLVNEHPTRRIRAPRAVIESKRLIGILEEHDIDAVEKWAVLADHWSFALRYCLLRDGLPFADRDDQHQVEQLLLKVGLLPIVDYTRNPPTLKPLRPSAGEAGVDGERANLTLWPVLAWTMAVVWITRRVRERQSLIP